MNEGVTLAAYSAAPDARFWGPQRHGRDLPSHCLPKGVGCVCVGGLTTSPSTDISKKSDFHPEAHGHTDTKVSLEKRKPLGWAGWGLWGLPRGLGVMRRNIILDSPAVVPQHCRVGSRTSSPQRGR